MQDLEAYPTEDLFKEIMKRCPDCLVLYTYEVVERNGDLQYQYLFKGDPEWMIKRLKREVIPYLQDELELTEEEDNE